MFPESFLTVYARKLKDKQRISGLFLLLTKETRFLKDPSRVRQVLARFNKRSWLRSNPPFSAGQTKNYQKIIKDASVKIVLISTKNATRQGWRRVEIVRDFASLAVKYIIGWEWEMQTGSLSSTWTLRSVTWPMPALCIRRLILYARSWDVACRYLTEENGTLGCFRPSAVSVIGYIELLARNDSGRNIEKWLICLARPCDWHVMKTRFVLLLRSESHLPWHIFDCVLSTFTCLNAPRTGRYYLKSVTTHLHHLPSRVQEF